MREYQICGLPVLSELELPGAVPAVRMAVEAAVRIRRGRAPERLADLTETGPCWEMSESTFLLQIPRLGRLMIEDGRLITVEVAPGAIERDVTGFVVGTAFGILLHQRGALVLHGSAVADGERALIICGASGSGKSTLAAALCEDGCAFVADDICAIEPRPHGAPVVAPDGRSLKLWRRSIDALNLGHRQGEAVRELFEKFFIEPTATPHETAKLSAIYILRENRLSQEPLIEPLTAPDALRTLEREAYRPRLRARLGRKAELFALAAATLRHARIYVLTRPRGFEHMEQTVGVLRAHWLAASA